MAVKLPSTMCKVHAKVREGLLIEGWLGPMTEVYLPILAIQPLQLPHLRVEVLHGAS